MILLIVFNVHFLMAGKLIHCSQANKMGKVQMQYRILITNYHEQPRFFFEKFVFYKLMKNHDF